MIWRPRLVALDIDGTIVDRQGELPDDVHDAIRRVVASGTPVVLTTGRAWLDARPVFDALRLPPGPVVASNGAVIVNYPPFVVDHMDTFDPAPVIREIARLAPRARIAVEDIGRGFRLSRYFPDGDLHGRLRLESLQSLASRPVSRVIVRDPDAKEADFLALAEHLGMHGVSYSVGWSAWLDIAPEGVDKSSGLARVCTELGVRPDHVLAIGDGRNDIEMLSWAGRGVAVGDAPWEVQQAADDVAANFEDGGTVAELDRWFAIGAASVYRRQCGVSLPDDQLCDEPLLTEQLRSA